jgi:TorA maturation chaperone TorD
MDTKHPQHNILKGYNMLLYFAGTMIMYEPSEECITDFWKNGILKKLPVSSSNPNFVKAASQLRNSCSDPAICGKMLRDDYIRLFSRSEMPLVPAFESLYSRNGQPGSDNQSPCVTDFYNSYGWTSKFRKKIKDDHLAVELLFLTCLIDKYLAYDDDACSNEMKKEILRYIDNHILSWIPEWNRKIQFYSETLSFKGIGTLILACIEDISSLLSQNPSTLFSTDDLKNQG